MRPTSSSTRLKAPATASAWFERAVPAASWLRDYSRADLQADVIAGVITAILLVPQAMAYALLAGLPPQVGLYASVVAPLAYALFGSSRTLAVGPVSVAAIMVATALAASDVQGHGTDVANALVLALEVGAILLAMAVLRLGTVVNFLSHPVLSGFTSGAAIVILLTQIPPLLGIASGPTTTSHEIIATIASGAAATKLATLAVGVASIVLLVLAGGPLQALLRRISDKSWIDVFGRAGPLVVVLLATAAVAGLGLDRGYGVATVGPLPAGLPRPSIDFLSLDTWATLLPSAALIAFISYVESISIAKILANRRRQRVNANQELSALGAANVAAAFSGGMPVAGGFSRTMVNFAAGARTQMAGIVTALLMGLTLLAFAALFARLPKAALAGVIVVAVARLIDVATLREAWRYQRGDAAVLLVTLGAVLILGIEVGLVVGILISLLVYVWRSSRPHMAIVGRVPGTEHFRNIRRHGVETWPNLVLVRVDESLTFTNISMVEDFVADYLATHRRVKDAVLVCNAVNHIDSSALDALERFVASLRDAGVTLHLAEVKGPVLDALERVDFKAKLAPGQIFFRINDAVATLARAGRTTVRESALAAV